ncbi:caspase family protein [Lusitaniella coriacea LEGE 07157]|uniref:Caspase family protein n=1 Tax=Lusitaniella coriacea LEGE 07157 TaxID=945747 RepID=A0A8J7ARK1_9CYAN|nr:caspase family protein [Lusitaniella coriacea]MBE9114791.1 caspase family protein [Lusitaniella coriacea LEGE 07157]
MANYSSLAIGINRYQFIQPLSYAQADAQAIWQFMVGEARIPPAQNLLLTDASAWIEDRATTPTKENILNWLKAGASEQPLPWMWFFFSGYGVCWEGADYLMPIDGNPKDIPGTGISVRSLFHSLQQQRAERLLVLLDINRSPGILAGDSVGVETTELAKEMGIPVILSSQLQQTSHESSELGHGMFAATLLEALRYYNQDLTLDKLDGYLRDRLPELCEHHWRPPQVPLTLVPSPELKRQLILPGDRALLDWELVGTNGAAILATENVKVQSNGKASSAKIATSAPITRQPPPLVPPNSTNSSPPPGDTRMPAKAEEPNSPRPIDYKKWILVGGGLALLFSFLGIVGQPLLKTLQPASVENPGEIETVNPTGETETPAPVAQSPETAIPSPIASPQPSAQQEATTPSPAASPVATNAAPAGMAASTHIQSVQASKFGRAIADARKVPPDSPNYKEAQRCINTWSLSILDIARGRAKQGNFSGAIAAASLIGTDEQEIYTLAQQKIKTWNQLEQKQQKNGAIIAAARKLIQPTQASSYGKAIQKLREVPLGEPGHPEAKKLIENWGKQVYLIANSRAARQEFQSAIAAAQFVPSDTSSHPKAKAAIARWQKGER